MSTLEIWEGRGISAAGEFPYYVEVLSSEAEYRSIHRRVWEYEGKWYCDIFDRPASFGPHSAFIPSNLTKEKFEMLWNLGTSRW